MTKKAQTQLEIIRTTERRTQYIANAFSLKEIQKNGANQYYKETNKIEK